jgi:hypothetical protein
MLQRGQLLSGPVSVFVLGLLTSILYARALGWVMAMKAGLVLGIVMGVLAAWMVYRSDYAARHLAVGVPLYLVMMGLFSGGGNLALMQVAGIGEWAGVAWLVGVSLATVPALAVASRVRARLTAEGLEGPWVRQHLDLRSGLLGSEALLASENLRPSMTGWQVGALAANVPLLWRLQGGNDSALLSLALLLLTGALVWAGVSHAGPALGKAWFLLDIEHRTGQRLRHPQWDQIQALRRSHWLARWFMREG